MSTPKKMNDNERKISNNLIKNITTLMLENEIYSDAECMRKIKENTGFDFNQSKFSDIKTGKTFPTTMELIAFSDFFNVSIDFLLGKERKETKLAIFETCKYIAKMFESDMNLGCATVTIQETSYFNNYPSEYEKTYNALFFSTETPAPFEELPFNTEIQPHQKAEFVNLFIHKMIDIHKMKRTISKELYNKIISEWLLEAKKYDQLTPSTYEEVRWTLPFV